LLGQTSALEAEQGFHRLIEAMTAFDAQHEAVTDSLASGRAASAGTESALAASVDEHSDARWARRENYVHLV
jgi:hypothetical protein